MASQSLLSRPRPIVDNAENDVPKHSRDFATAYSASHALRFSLIALLYPSPAGKPLRTLSVFRHAGNAAALYCWPPHPSRSVEHSPESLPPPVHRLWRAFLLA